jgi:transcriptional regulator with XRE-family HTH domain
VGYRGKLFEQQRARELRLQGLTLADIAAALGVSKSSVSLWVRDIPIEIRRRTAAARRPNSLQRARWAEIEECDGLGLDRLGQLSEDAFLAAGVALYAGEGAKRDGKISFANTDPGMMRLFCAWLRRFFDVDETRLRVRVYLHEGLDLDAAEEFWSDVTRVPRRQFTRPYRAVSDASIRLNKHEHGCAYLDYHCSRIHREIMGLVRALLASEAIPG